MKMKLNIVTTLLIGSVLLASCYKKFDPASYAPPFTINGFTKTSEIASANLVGYWSFDGSYVDSVSGTAATGVGTSLVPGFKGKAYQGAANSYVISNIPTAVASLQSFTISYWINTPINSNGIVGTVNVSRADDFWGYLDMFYENGATATSVTFKSHVVASPGKDTWVVHNISNPWNTWMNYTLTYDHTTGKFTVYVNGSSIATSTAATLGAMAWPATSKLIFGTVQFQTSPSLGTAGSSQPWANYLTGMMDEIRIYNKALSSTEIQSIIVLQGKGK